MFLKGALVLLAVCILLPCICMAARQNRNEPSQNPLPANRLNNLIGDQFNPGDYTHEKSCAICMMDYDAQSEIIPLPCDPRHYFHAQCITSWLEQNNRCPMCNTPISEDDINRQRQER